MLLPEHSLYNIQETAWDNLSLHYIDNPNEMAAKVSQRETAK